MSIRERIYWDDEDDLKAAFIGKSIAKVNDYTLELSDGRRVALVGNADCCAYYDLTELAGCPNVVTNVEVYADPAGDCWPGGEGVYRLFVYADNQKINLATFEGTDANGYYGTGFWLEIELPKVGEGK